MYNVLKLSAVFFLLLSAMGCASSYLKGVTAEGEKVYLGPTPIENTEAYKNYITSKQTDVDKQRYIFQRLKAAKDLSFFHNGSWYSSLDAYRGGMWLMREKYKPGQNAKEFIQKYVERSLDTNQLHIVKYPDGSMQLGSAILYNELDLLEETARKSIT